MILGGREELLQVRFRRVQRPIRPGCQPSDGRTHHLLPICRVRSDVPRHTSALQYQVL